MTKLFEKNPSVMFGDVTLSEDGVQTAFGKPQSPGAGGWPTIRYYNKETGYGGAAYKKKTKASMCDELGTVENMQAYVEDAASTSLCDIESQEGCTKLAKKFLDKWGALPAADMDTELKRLEKMLGQKKNVADSAAGWTKQRVQMLKSLKGKTEL